MKINGFSILILLIALQFVLSKDLSDGNVIFVDKEDIDVYVGQHPIVLVHWFASWCSFCKEFAPTWSKMSDIVYESENDFELVKVELGDDQEWKDRYMVNAFPDFGVFVNSTYYRFSGKKEAGDLLQFVVNRTNDGVLRVNDESMITYLRDHGNAVSTCLVNPDSKEEEIFKHTVLRDQNVVFILPTPEVRDQILQREGKTIPTIFFEKSYDDRHVFFEQEFTAENVQQFNIQNSIPTVYPTSNPRYNNYFYTHGHEWLTVLVDKANAKYPSAVSQRFVDLCKKNPEAVCFYVGNNEKGMYDFFVKGQAVTYPAMIVAHHVRGYYFRAILSSVDKESIESMTFFQEGVMSKSIPMIMKSQPPFTNEPGPLRSVVGSDFVSKVVDSKEDIVVIFYSTYCDHCTKVLKRMAKVAEFFEKDSGLRIYKYNSQDNDVDLDFIHAKHFHSVLYLRKGEKLEVTEYPRSKKIWRTKSLIKWIASMRDEPKETQQDEEELSCVYYKQKH